MLTSPDRHQLLIRTARHQRCDGHHHSCLTRRRTLQAQESGSRHKSPHRCKPDISYRLRVSILPYASATVRVWAYHRRLIDGHRAVLATLVSFAYVKDYANREDITCKPTHSRPPIRYRPLTMRTAPTDTIIPISITSVVELWLGIVCACLATMRPLLRDISRRVRGIKTAYSDSSYQKYGSSRNETCPPSRDDLLERDTDIGAGGGYAINTTDSIADTERNYSDGSGKTLGKSRNGSGNDNMRDHIREEGGKGTVVELRDIELPRRAVG